MGLLDKIKEIEFEMSQTQKNKATEFHFAIMKSRLAKLRSQLLEPPKKTGPSEGFDGIKHGDARVCLIGFPSVGKSTILNLFTDTNSEVNPRDFTTLKCIPGVLKYNNCNIIDMYISLRGKLNITYTKLPIYSILSKHNN